MTIAHELHLTFSVDPGRLDAFASDCVDFGGKAIVIELARGEMATQPMFTKVVHVSVLADARAACDGIRRALGERGYHWQREKIEIPADHAPEHPRIGKFGPETYFEWHGKVVLHDADALRLLCESRGAHLSRNALKGASEIRFVTLREYGSKSRFDERIQDLAVALQRGGWTVIKSQRECCLYDDRPHLDRGWLADDASGLPQALAYEGFIRRAATIDAPFMLKGSFVGRHYFANPDHRWPQDLDWVHLGRLDDVEVAKDTFSDWVQTVTNVQLDDAVTFTPFHQNDFWRAVDYAMADDFPTTSTDLSAVVDGLRYDLTLEISFNLDIPLAPVPLVFKPMRGPSFVVPKTVPLPLQISWKLHQTMVRARFKDLNDLTSFVRHPAFDTAAISEMLEALIAECDADGVDPRRLLDVLEGRWDDLFERFPIEQQFAWWRFPLASHATGPTVAIDGGPRLQSAQMRLAHVAGDLASFRSEFVAACDESGLTAFAERRLRSLPLEPSPTSRLAAVRHVLRRIAGRKRG